MVLLTDVLGLNIWACQTEQASDPTTYILTLGSTGTRVNDQYTKTGIGNLINSAEGVFYVESKTTYDSSTSRRLSLSDGNIGNRVLLEFDETTENAIKAV